MATVIRTVYFSKEKGRPGWPYQDFDPQERASELEKELSKLKGTLNFDASFVGCHVITGMEDISKLKESISEGDDGMLIFFLSDPVGLSQVLEIDIPKVSFIDLFGYNIQTVPSNVIGISSSDFSEIGKGLKAIDTVRRLKESKILWVGPSGWVRDLSSYQTQAKERFGIEIKEIGRKVLVNAYEAANETEAEEIASEFIGNAEKVVEPTREDVLEASKMYLGIKKVMEEEKADAISINCLYYDELLPAYPCFAFSKLNDEGLIATCEGDLNSTLTQMIVGFLGDVPGFVSDPVIDISTNTIVHSHCTAATKMGGVESSPEPYVIRSHAEDNKGVSLQVKMKVGQKVTHAKLEGFDTMLMATGEIIGNVDIDKGCRTKVAMRVKDARKLYENYRGGLHRVAFHGDLLQQVKDLGKLLSFTVVEEC